MLTQKHASSCKKTGHFSFVQVFTERPANDPQTERMRPDLVIEFLARFPAAVIIYLEFLIFKKKLQVSTFCEVSCARHPVPK